MQNEMLEYLGRNWGWVVLRGVVAVLFGVVAFAWPGITLAALVIVWGAYALADGVLALIAAWQVRDQGRPFWALVIVGLLGIAAGVVTFMWPAITALTLLMIIAVWAVMMGIFQIVAAVRLRKVVEGEWWLGLAGLLSVIFGVAMFATPGAGALAVIWVIGAYAIVFGVLLIALGVRLKQLASGGPPHGREARAV
jgi:uncharacterized membrane protein HdeD (DUF308 family)